MREIIFSPTPVTALCFINDRDILVGMDKIMSVVTSAKYMTPHMISHVDATNADIKDPPAENYEIKKFIYIFLLKLCLKYILFKSVFNIAVICK